VAVVADAEGRLTARRCALAFVGALAVAALAPVAAVEPTKLVPAQSEVTFQLRQSGVPVEGRFKRFDAQLVLDPKAPQTGSVAVTIDTASATVGFAESDAELPGALWFDAKKYPRAVFQSSAISGGGGRFQARGKLELKGTARELVVPVNIVQSGPLSTATGEFVLKRLEYKIGEKEWADVSLIADDVRVRFKLVFTGVGAL
jgi:polyisoprenoid-binding protein YceI